MGGVDAVDRVGLAVGESADLVRADRRARRARRGQRGDRAVVRGRDVDHGCAGAAPGRRCRRCPRRSGRSRTRPRRSRSRRAGRSSASRGARSRCRRGQTGDRVGAERLVDDLLPLVRPCPTMVGFTPGTVIVPRKTLYAVGLVPVTLPVPSTVTLTPTLVNGSGGADWYVTRAPSARVRVGDLVGGDRCGARSGQRDRGRGGRRCGRVELDGVGVDDPDVEDGAVGDARAGWSTRWSGRRPRRRSRSGAGRRTGPSSGAGRRPRRSRARSRRPGRR